MGQFETTCYALLSDPVYEHQSPILMRLVITYESQAVGEVPNPLDVDYGLLNCELELLDKKAAEYKVRFQIMLYPFPLTTNLQQRT